MLNATSIECGVGHSSPPLNVQYYFAISAAGLDASNQASTHELTIPNDVSIKWRKICQNQQTLKHNIVTVLSHLNDQSVNNHSCSGDLSVKCFLAILSPAPISFPANRLHNWTPGNQNQRDPSDVWGTDQNC